LACEATTTVAHKIMIVELLCDLGTRYGLYRCSLNGCSMVS